MVMSDPVVRMELTRRGVGPMVTGSPEQLQAFIKSEIARWSDVVRRAAIEGSL